MLPYPYGALLKIAIGVALIAYGLLNNQPIPQ